MVKPYKLLRQAMFMQDVDQQYLGGLIGRGATYVNLRMTGKRPWTQEDQYKIMDTLNLPYERMHEYFPPNGIPVQQKARAV